MFDEIKVFDSLTKKNKQLKINKTIKMYVCGPTVYDHCHIGHARMLIVFDAFRRFLSELTNVIFVQNITDVSEKINEKAVDNNTTVQSIVDKYSTSFRESTNLLNILPPDVQPKASEYINQMITYIEHLLSKNKAYITKTGIYLDTDQIPYWQFEDRSNVNDNIDDDRRSQHHFALWKFNDHANNYKSPWGYGDPGWHIECSVMSSEILGNHFDIHGGGADLQFPHHENEIAQSEAMYSHGPADLWMHNGMINLRGDKMSKSLGNFWYIKDMIHNSYDADAFRYLVLSHNYRNIIEITDEKIHQSKETMKNIRKYYFKHIHHDFIEKNKSETHKDILQILSEDFNSSELLSNLSKYINDNNYSAVYYTMKILGFRMEKLCKLSHGEISNLVILRDKAKFNRDFEFSDSIRQKLQDNFIILEDTNDGTEWFYI
jgi:cysteinyl-tRNA synthetase